MRYVISVARSRIKGTKRHIFGLSLLVGAVYLLIAWLWGGDPYAGEPASIWYYVAISAMSGVTAVLYATVGLVAAAGEKVTFGGAFRFMNRVPGVWLVTVPMSLLFSYLEATVGSGGWVLLSLPLTPMAFWVYYYLDRDMNPFKAIAKSYSLVLNNLGSYLLIALLLGALLSVGLITLGIGFIWILPFILIASGVMFAEASGLQGDYSS